MTNKEKKMKRNFKNVLKDDSGQAMTEYVILTVATALPLYAFLNADVLNVFPGGIYQNIYSLLRWLQWSAALPFFK